MIRRKKQYIFKYILELILIFDCVQSTKTDEFITPINNDLTILGISLMFVRFLHINVLATTSSFKSHKYLQQFVPSLSQLFIPTCHFLYKRFLTVKPCSTTISTLLLTLLKCYFQSQIQSCSYFIDISHR